MFYKVYFRMWDGTCRTKTLYCESKYDLYAYIGYYKCTEIERIDYIAYKKTEILNDKYDLAKETVMFYINNKGEI